MAVNLVRPPNRGKKIALLKGAMHFMVPMKLETLEVDDVLSAEKLSRTIAGRRITITKARKMQGGYEVQVTLFREGLDDAEWQQMSNPRDYVRLVDENGHLLNFTGVGENEAGDKQATLALQFENLRGGPIANADLARGAGAKRLKLVWDIPLEAKEISIPFEFKDLALP
jgi:hypothetical protein